jgi:uncharacterized protein (DUF305 family)
MPESRRLARSPPWKDPIMPAPKFRLLGLLAILLPFAASAQDMKGMTMSPTGDGGSSAAFTAANEKMMTDMAVPPTGDADRDFVAGMIPHHAGAVDMAQIELHYGKDPALKKLARDIVASQTKEIAFMKRWQATHAR